MATRSATKILADIVNAFTQKIPALAAMGMNFGVDPLFLNQVLTAHIEKLPASGTYDTTDGYGASPNDADNLLEDIPVTIDMHKHVHVALKHLSNITNQKKYIKTINNQAYVLGKLIIDSVLAKVKGNTISFEYPVASASIDYDDLVAICGQMNINMAATEGRRGIVNTAVMNALQGDSRIASGDYHGQLQRGKALRVLTDIAGFEAIYEYPDMPTNNAATGTFTAATTDICTKVAHGFKTGDKVRVSSATTLPAGLAAATTYFVIRMTDDTFKLATTDALATAGTAVDITDTGTGAHSIVGYENLSGFFFEDRAFVLKTGVPQQTSDYAKELGIPEVNRTKVIQDPASNLALLSIMWQKGGLLDLNCAVAAIWGSAVGRQAGAQYAMTDRAGMRLVTAA